MFKSVRLLAVGALLVSSSAGAGTAPPPGSYFKRVGSVQCSPSRMTDTALAAMTASLHRAGVNVGRALCGTDGLMHAAMCGGDNGDIWLVTAPETSADAMKKLGFAPVSELPQAMVVDCAKGTF